MADNQLMAALDAMIDGYQKTAVLYCTVQWQLPELLSAGEKPVDALAAHLGIGADYLRRVLKALAAMGVCNETAPDRFVLTETGKDLTPDSASGLRERVLLAVDHYLDVWLGLSSGPGPEKTVFEQRHGCSPWQYRRNHPEVGTLFDRWLACEAARPPPGTRV